MRTYLTSFPLLIAELHPHQNDGLKPEEITSGSHRKLWWLCPKGHEYEQKVQDRTKNGRGCPYCSGKRVSKENSLSINYPKVAAEWHPNKNEKKSPDDFTLGSGKKVWWLCPEGHEYEQRILERATRGRGCPYCSGKRVSKENSLSINYPEVAAEWHPNKNEKKSPDDFTLGSGKKVWWLCPKGHEYQSVIGGRTVRGRGCPECYEQNRSYIDVNRRPEISLSSERPDLCREWHPEKNLPLTPENYTPGSGISVWWLCPQGHDYEQRIIERTGEKSVGCPYCAGRRVSDANSLSINYPEVAAEWHPTKNKGKKPEEYSFGSQKKVWWLCPKGHEYQSVIGGRTVRGRGCPECSNQSSRPEIRILTELKLLFETVNSRMKLGDAEIDVYIPALKTGIEYDGWYYHKDKINNDIAKNSILEKEGIYLIRVRQKPLEKISEYDIEVEGDDLSKTDMNKIIARLSSFCDSEEIVRLRKYLGAEQFQNEDVFRKYVSYFPSPFPEHSLALNNQALCQEWHPDKNLPLTPENFTPGSGVSVWWLCPRGHEYEQKILERARRGRGCPYCSGKRVSKENSLSINYPEIAAEWHPTKNEGKTPDNFTSGSQKKVWWLCPGGHEYKSVIGGRTGRGRGCPKCYEENRNKPGSGGRRLSKLDSN
jgi:DNA-directed RNA polymerase subunit RPC12/RpoP